MLGVEPIAAEDPLHAVERGHNLSVTNNKAVAGQPVIIDFIPGPGHLGSFFSSTLGQGTLHTIGWPDYTNLWPSSRIHVLPNRGCTCRPACRSRTILAALRRPRNPPAACPRPV